MTKTFKTAEAAWFAAMSVFLARRNGEKATSDIDADAVLKVLDRLYRRRAVDLVHARVLRVWGERGCAPDYASDLQIWNAAMAQMEWPLRVKGIVA